MVVPPEDRREKEWTTYRCRDQGSACWLGYLKFVSDRNQFMMLISKQQLPQSKFSAGQYFFIEALKLIHFQIHPNSLHNWASCGCRPFWCFARSLLSLQSWPFSLHLSWKPAVMGHVIPLFIAVWWPPCPPLSDSSTSGFHLRLILSDCCQIRCEGHTWLQWLNLDNSG